MPNDFSHDNNCIALWKFENVPGFGIDSRGNNDMTLVSVTPETTLIQEGAQASNHPLPISKFTCSDSSLDTGFPLRLQDGASAGYGISVAAWARFTVLSTVSSAEQTVWAKYCTGGDLRTMIVWMELNNKIRLRKGYNSGQSAEYDQYETVPSLDTWYHFSMGYEETNKSYFLVIKDSAGTSLGADLSRNFVQTTSLRVVPFTLGGVGNTKSLRGYLDEVVVWDVKKSLGDMEKVRKGTYNWRSFGNLSPNIQSLTHFTGGG